MNGHTVKCCNRTHSGVYLVSMQQEFCKFAKASNRKVRKRIISGVVRPMKINDILEKVRASSFNT